MKTDTLTQRAWDLSEQCRKRAATIPKTSIENSGKITLLYRIADRAANVWLSRQTPNGWKRSLPYWGNIQQDRSKWFEPQSHPLA